MPDEQGIFLGETWRFGDAICAFTSEVFYEGKLRPTAEKGLDRQRMVGGPLDGAGLFVIDVDHDGNRNGADEEVAAVKRLVDQLLAPGSLWVDHGVGGGHLVAHFDVEQVTGGCSTRTGEPDATGAAMLLAIAIVTASRRRG